MELVKPDKKYLSSYYEACKETWGCVHDNYIIHNPEDFENWKDNIFIDYENAPKGIGLLEGFVPNVTYWLIDSEEYLGTVNIRFELSDKLKEYGGNLGIMLRKSARGKGYGVKMLELGLNKIKELKILPIILTCEEDNTASWHIVEHFKYKKRELYTTLINNKLTEARRYYI